MVLALQKENKYKILCIFGGRKSAVGQRSMQQVEGKYLPWAVSVYGVLLYHTL